MGFEYLTNVPLQKAREEYQKLFDEDTRKLLEEAKKNG